jgi:hypothetical protein
MLPCRLVAFIDKVAPGVLRSAAPSIGLRLRVDIAGLQSAGRTADQEGKQE